MSNPKKLTIKCTVGFLLAVLMLIFAIITNAGCQKTVYKLVNNAKPKINHPVSGMAVIIKSVKTNSFLNHLRKPFYTEYLLTLAVTGGKGQQWQSHICELVDGKVELHQEFAVIYDEEHPQNVQLAEQEQIPTEQFVRHDL